MTAQSGTSSPPGEHLAPDWDDLFRRARAVAANAYCPYSRYHVGAAGLVDDGRIVVGCNVENASYGLALCAECALVSSLHTTGGGRLVAMAVVGGYDVDDLPAGNPCGRCRQLLYEAGGAELVVNRDWTMTDLLPGAFGPQDL